MTRILRGNRDGVDFDEPVFMTSAQREKLLEHLRESFAVVEEEEVAATDFRADRLGDRLFPREWSTKELRVLLERKDNDEVCKLLGRSWMSVDIKRGEFIPQFLEWAHRTGNDITRGDLRRLVEAFLDEKRVAIENKRKERSRRRSVVRSLEQERSRQAGLLESRKILIGAGRTDLEPTIREIQERIRSLDQKIRGQTDQPE